MIFLLLIVFQLKHFLADYPLQGSYMLGKFQDGWKWVLPLTAHAGVHFGFTFVICALYSGNLNLAGLLALLDFVLHFSMDRIKASPTMLGKYKALTKAEYLACKMGIEEAERNPSVNKTKLDFLDECYDRLDSNVRFWWALGLDQGVHHLTHYLIIYLLMR